MNLFEYQGKELFSQFGIPIPEGRVCFTPGEAAAKASSLGGRVVVKAQVQAGGRGKAGGVALCDTSSSAKTEAERILKLKIKGLDVKAVLVERALDISSEFYMGLILDRASKQTCLIFSPEGGIDIEEVARLRPKKLRRVAVPAGARDLAFPVRQAVYGFGLAGPVSKSLVALGVKLIRMYIESDATMAEINPVVITAKGEVIAADSKVVIDDNALGRQEKLSKIATAEGQGSPEWEAKQSGLSFVGLKGSIGCVVNGAGLAMATMDLVKYYGGEPANFLDIGGSSNPGKVTTALRLLTQQKGVKVILFNIFGGITRCDDVARGLLQALADFSINVPIIIRLTGTNEVEGRKILDKANQPLIVAQTMAEAVQKAVAAVKN